MKGHYSNRLCNCSTKKPGAEPLAARQLFCYFTVKNIEFLALILLKIVNILLVRNNRLLSL